MTAKSANKNPDKPNIIYILADDLGYGELGAYGQTKIETPNIDALAAGGMIFTQHYTGAPVCAPARSVLLTGKHLGHSPVRGNDPWRSRGDVWNYKSAVKDSTLEGQLPLPEGTTLLPEYLREAGYRTGMIGKWGLGAPHSHSIPTKMGFDYFYGYNCQRQAHSLTPVHLYENDYRVYLPNDTTIPGTGIPTDADPRSPEAYAAYNQPAYAPTLSFEKLMDFVREEDDQPFFLYWATPIPHLPLQAPKQWVDYYVEKFGDEDPYYFREGEKGSYFPTRYPHATYAAMVSYLDENVGKLVAHLKETGEFDNTLIIFTSDNGPTYLGGADSPWFNSGGPFPEEYGRGKGFLYEGGIRVPMIASWPGHVPAGSRTDHISGFQDVLPTLCTVAKTSAPDNTDGIDFMPTLLNESNQLKHDYLYWEYPEYKGQVAVRMEKWKIIWKNIKKDNKHVEVYDLSVDPAEQNDLADQHPEMVKRFFEIIQAEHQTPANKRFEIPAVEALFSKK
jgi:arylsulfatase